MRFGELPDVAAQRLKHHMSRMFDAIVLNREALLGASGCAVALMGWLLYQFSSRCPDCGACPVWCRCEHRGEHRTG